jgi:hypothetical protein
MDNSGAMRRSLPSKKFIDDIEVKKTGYYLRPHKNARPIKLGSTRVEAIKTLRYLRGKRQGVKLRRRKAPSREPVLPAMEKIKRALYYSMVKKASSKRIKAMTWREFELIWARAGGKCELTGIEFSLQSPRLSQRRPWAPTLDRKDASAGYTPKNCRLICSAVNIALNDWGEEALLKIAKALFPRQDFGKFRR